MIPSDGISKLVCDAHWASVNCQSLLDRFMDHSVHLATQRFSRSQMLAVGNCQVALSLHGNAPPARPITGTLVEGLMLA